MTDGSVSCCSSLYFVSGGSWTQKSSLCLPPLHTNKRQVVTFDSRRFFCLSLHHKHALMELLIFFGVSWLCLRTQRLTQSQEVDVKWPLSHKERSCCHFMWLLSEKSSETGSVYEYKFQWHYWWTISVHNRIWRERICDSCQISSSSAGWHQAILYSALFLGCGGELVGVVYTCK